MQRTAKDLALNNEEPLAETNLEMNEQWREAGDRVSNSKQWDAMTAKAVTLNNGM